MSVGGYTVTYNFWATLQDDFVNLPFYKIALHKKHDWYGTQNVFDTFTFYLFLYFTIEI